MDAMGTATKNMHHIKVKMLVQHGREDMVSCLWGGRGGGGQQNFSKFDMRIHIFTITLGAGPKAVCRQFTRANFTWNS